MITVERTFGSGNLVATVPTSSLQSSNKQQEKSSRKPRDISTTVEEELVLRKFNKGFKLLRLY